jgi:hypothetical protein
MDHAKYMHEAALYCQVMLGLELLALRESHPETRGRKPKREIVAATATISFVDLIKKETGLSQCQGYQIIRMAEAAIPRLKKAAGLRDFNPTAQGVALLPEGQRAALSAAVRKLTDGLTQTDFLIALGLAKAPGGAGAKGGNLGGKKADLTADEEAAAHAKLGLMAYHDGVTGLRNVGIRFTLLPDEAVMGQVADLEALLPVLISARKTWLRQPKDRRDPTSIQPILDSLI